MVLPSRTCELSTAEPEPGPHTGDLESHLISSPSYLGIMPWHNRDDAVAGAKTAFRSWASLPAGKRRDILYKVRPRSLVSCQLSPFTFHLSPFTFHLSPFTFHLLLLRPY
jgi:hypothetical protein